MSTARHQRRYRVARTTLVLAALLFHGWSMGRMPLAALGGIALLLGMGMGWRPKLGRDALVILTVSAAFLGASDLLAEPTPDGAIPSVWLSPLTTVLIALSVTFTLARRTTPAWATALVLVVLSCCVPPRNPLTIAGPLTAVVSLGSIAALAWRGPWRRDRALALGAALALTAAGAGGITMANAWAEGMLMPLLQAWVVQGSFGSGSNMQPGVSLSALAHAPSSGRVLFELNGPAPTTLRTQVMDRFDGEHWTSSKAITLPRATAVPADGPRLPLELTFFTRARGVLPTPGGLAEIEGEPPTFNQGWLVPQGAGRGEVVQLERTPFESLPTESAPPDDTLVQLPPELALALEPWAEAIAGDARGAHAKARAMERYLMAEHTWAETADLRGEDHPLVVLLRDQRDATCGYFASAMAAMLRTQGIPARLAGGFAPTDTNPWTGRTVVRTRDAHAWVEVWLPERGGWVAFDPTPISGRDASTPVPGPVTGLLRAGKDGLHRLLVRLQGYPDEVLAEALASWPTTTIAALVALLFGWRWAHRLWIHRAPRRERALRDRRLWPHYRRYQRLLCRAGVGPDPVQSDEQTLIRIAEALGPTVGDTATAFVRSYQQARYGRGDPRAPKAALARLRSAMKARTGSSGRSLLPGVGRWTPRFRARCEGAAPETPPGRSTVRSWPRPRSPEPAGG